MNLQEGYGLLPNFILFHKTLTDKQKLLYCFISSLCAEKGYSRRTNKYIGEKLGVTEGTISKNISTLKELALIHIIIGDDLRERKMYISTPNDLGPPPSDLSLPPLVKNDYPPSQKSPPNNIINNNINNNNIIADEIYNYYIKLLPKERMKYVRKADAIKWIKTILKEKIGKEQLISSINKYVKETEIKYRMAPQYFFCTSEKGKNYRVFENYLSSSSPTVEKKEAVDLGF